MADDSYDDVVNNIAKVMEQLLKNLQVQDLPHIIGCTIIAGSDGRPPTIIMNREGDEIDYEIIDAGDRIYISAEVPADMGGAPSAIIHPDCVTLTFDDQELAIELEHEIDVIHSFYDIRHGVIDVVCYKT